MWSACGDVIAQLPSGREHVGEASVWAGGIGQNQSARVRARRTLEDRTGGPTDR